MKRQLSALLCLTLIVTSAGCSTTFGASPANPTETLTPVPVPENTSKSESVETPSPQFRANATLHHIPNGTIRITHGEYGSEKNENRTVITVKQNGHEDWTSITIQKTTAEYQPITRVKYLYTDGELYEQRENGTIYRVEDSDTDLSTFLPYISGYYLALTTEDELNTSVEGPDTAYYEYADPPRASFINHTAESAVVTINKTERGWRLTELLIQSEVYNGSVAQTMFLIEYDEPEQTGFTDPELNRIAVNDVPTTESLAPETQDVLRRMYGDESTMPCGEPAVFDCETPTGE